MRPLKRPADRDIRPAGGINLSAGV